MLLPTLGVVACLAMTQAPPPIAASEGSARDLAREAGHASSAFLTSPATSVNGRPFVGRDGSSKPASPMPSDGAMRHGAGPEAPATIIVSVAGLFGFEQEPRRFEIDPFTPVEVRRGDNRWSNSFARSQEKLAARVEEARRSWLADNNYTGGIRTFKSPAAERKVADASTPAPADARKIEPRAVFELPPDMPRLRTKIRVMGKDESPVRRADARVRVAAPPAEQKVASTPASAPPKG
ncbi:MAG: hypothetical protein WCK33_13030 [Phycisphaerae bacterium]